MPINSLDIMGVQQAFRTPRKSRTLRKYTTLCVNVLPSGQMNISYVTSSLHA